MNTKWKVINFILGVAYVFTLMFFGVWCYELGAEAEVPLLARIAVLEADMEACCSTEYQDETAEGIVTAMGRLRQGMDELKWRIEVLEGFLEGKGEGK